MKKKTRIYLTGLLLVSIGAASLIASTHNPDIEIIGVGLFVVRYI